MADPLAQRERHRKRADAATIEHVLPRALGGIAAWPNEVAACRACNAAKADRLPTPVELWRLAWLHGMGERAGDDAIVLALLRAEAA